MFRKIFNWSGESEEELMKVPRVVPDPHKETPPGDDKWIMSREFAQENKPHVRNYLAARLCPGDIWEIVLVNYQVNKDALGSFATAPRGLERTPAGVIHALMEFEKTCRNPEAKIKHVPVPGSYPTYIPFANRHGLHLDAEGNLIEIKKDQPIMHETFIPRGSLNLLFNKEAALNTWEGLYERVVNKLSTEMLEKADIASTAGHYEHFKVDAATYLEKLKKFEEKILSDTLTLGQKVQLVSDLPSLSVNIFAEREQRLAALYLADVSMLVQLLRVGNKIYQQQFTDGKEIPKDGLKLIRRIGDAVSLIAWHKLNLKTDDAGKIVDIIGNGPDPFGAALPLEAFIQKNPTKPPVPKIEL